MYFFENWFLVCIGGDGRDGYNWWWWMRWKKKKALKQEVYFFFSIWEWMLFADPVRRGGRNVKKIKIGVKLSFYMWVDQLTEPYHQINNVTLIRLKDEILNIKQCKVTLKELTFHLKILVYCVK